MDTAEARVPAIEIPPLVKARFSPPSWLPWLPVIACITAIVALYPLHLPAAHEPRLLAPLVNTAIFVMVSLVAAVLAGWSFCEEGAPSLMFLGNGMLVFGLGSMLGPLLYEYVGHNVGITVQGVSAAIAAILHIVSGYLVWRPVSVHRRRLSVTLVSYLLSAILVALVCLIAIRGVLPHFFEGGSGTDVRDSILSVTVVLYLFAATLFGLRARVTQAIFLRWYSLGLGLIGIGLGAVGLAVVGSPLAWTGRLAQNLGQVYILICLIVALWDAEETSAGPAIAHSFRQIEEALRESQAQYDFLFDAANDGVILYRPRTRSSSATILKYNCALESMLGREPRLEDFEETPDLDQSPALAKIAGEGRGATHLVARTLAAGDGREVPVEMSVRRFWLDGEQRVLVIVRNIAGRIESQQALERERAIATGINRILRAALVAPTESEVGRECVAVAEEITGSRFGFIAQVSPDNYLYNAAISDAGWAACAMSGKLGHSKLLDPAGASTLYGSVLSEGLPMFTNEPTRHPDSAGLPKGHPQLDSFLGVPLLSSGCVVGIVGVGNRPGGYSQAELQTLEGVAPSMVEALERFRAELALAESARLAHELTDIESLIHSSLDFEKIAQDALRSGARILGAKAGSISLYEPPNFKVAHSYGYEEPIEGQEFPVRKEEHGLMAIQSKSPVIIENASEDPRVDLAHRQGYGIEAVMLFPLVVSGEATGFIHYNFDKPRRFSKAEINFGERLSSSLSLAMENARLFSRERANARINEALSRIDRSIHSSLDQDEILDRVVAQSAGAIGAESILLALREGEAWVLRHGYNISPGLVGRVFFDIDFPAAGLAVERGEPLAVEDAAADSRTRGLLQQNLSMGSVMIAPVAVRGKAVAAVFFVYRGRRRFQVDERRYAEGLAKSVGLAMANARLYQTEHRIADTLQEMLVVVPTHVPGVIFSRSYETATLEQARVGGDFVDIFEVHANMVAIAIGDVSGKGIDAAVTTSLVRNTLRTHAIDGLSPTMVCQKANMVVRQFTSVESFVTVFFALLNTKTGLLRYVCAGHPPALVLSPDRGVLKLQCTDPILGAFDDAVFSEHHRVLGKGERLVLYSDGITEARDPSGGFFELEGLLSAIDDLDESSTSSLSDRLMDRIKEFSSGVLRDDAAILVVEPTRLKASVPNQPQLDLN